MISLVKQYFFAVPFPINSDDSFCVDEAIIIRKLIRKVTSPSPLFDPRPQNFLHLISQKGSKNKNLSQQGILKKLKI